MNITSITTEIASKVSSPRKMYSAYNRAYRDIEGDIKRAITAMNLRVSDIVWDAFDNVEDELVYFLSKINMKCDQKIRAIITHICRKVLICISNTLLVDLTMDCIFKYRSGICEKNYEIESSEITFNT